MIDSLIMIETYNSAVPNTMDEESVEVGQFDSVLILLLTWLGERI